MKIQVENIRRVDNESALKARLDVCLLNGEGGRVRLKRCAILANTKTGEFFVMGPSSYGGKSSRGVDFYDRHAEFEDDSGQLQAAILSAAGF